MYKRAVEQKPIVESTECMHEGFCSLYRQKLILSNGHAQTYYHVETRPFAALVVATTPTGEYVLVREYRHAVQKVLIGLPGGFIEDHEDPIEAAKRELLEETGYAATTMRQIGSSFPLPGLLAQQVFFFHAIDAQVMRAPQLDAGEALETVVWTHGQLMQAIQEGAFLDSALCAGLFFYNCSSN